MECVYQYEFRPSVPMSDVESSLLLAIWATEGLYGESETRLDSSYELDELGRRLTISAATEVGRSLNKILLGFLRREFSVSDFEVKRIVHGPELTPATQ